MAAPNLVASNIYIYMWEKLVHDVTLSLTIFRQREGRVFLVVWWVGTIYMQTCFVGEEALGTDMNTIIECLAACALPMGGSNSLAPVVNRGSG